MPDVVRAPLPQFNAEATCAKCGHDDIRTNYQPDTSHYDCPIAKEMQTSYGPEHLTRCCQRCHFQWEEATRDNEGDGEL